MSEQDATPETPKRSPNEPIIIPLRKPFMFGSRSVETLTVRPVKGKDMRRINKADGDAATTLKMASILTGEVAEVIDELQGEDLGEVLAAVNFFFVSIQATGLR